MSDLWQSCWRIGLLISVTLILAGNAHADLHFSRPTIDLGQIRIGQAIEHDFEFTNRGPGEIYPVEVKASCGCLLPVIEQRNFAAGEKGRLTLKVNTLSAPPGPHVWSVQLHYREDGKLRTESLAVKADVIQEIAVTPPAMVIYAAGPVQHKITLKDLRDRSFQVLNVEGSSPHMETKVAEEYRDPAGHMVRQISLEIDADQPSGRFDEQVIIHTSDPQYEVIRVPITVVKRLAGRYTALPGKVEVAASQNQPMPSRIVTVRDTQGKPVIIDKVEADDPAVACRWAQGANTVGTIKVTVDSGRLTSAGLESQIHVHFRSEGGEVLSIPVTCAVR